MNVDKDGQQPFPAAVRLLSSERQIPHHPLFLGAGSAGSSEISLILLVSQTENPAVPPEDDPAVPPKSETPSVRDWDRDFQDKKISLETIRALVLDLSNARRHDEVIACLEAAIRNGQVQPWMYEVLALSMELAGRPREEVERVLLSSQDLTAQDVDSLLFLGSYLLRFQRDERALDLYRQASQYAPTRYEPYVMALPVAARQHAAESLAWAAAGLERYDWSISRDQHLREARNAVAAETQRLLQAGDFLTAIRLQETVRRAAEQDLTLRLEWSGTGDLDMVVKEPPGTVCSVQAPHSAAGGLHLHDGYGPQPKNCYELYVCPLAFPGEYQVVIQHAYGTIVGKRARLTITRHAGSPREQSVVHSLLLGAEETVVRLSLPTGRRSEMGLSAAPSPSRPTKGAQPNQVSRQLSQLAKVQSQVGGAGGTQNFASGAVGYQPVITTISEGITLGARAVISGDRRYVRISAQPLFSVVTDVFTFSFVQ